MNNSDSEYIDAMRSLMNGEIDRVTTKDEDEPYEVEEGNYECTKCGWTTDIDGAFRTRERNWCKVDKDIQWFKKLT